MAWHKWRLLQIETSVHSHELECSTDAVTIGQTSIRQTPSYLLVCALAPWSTQIILISYHLVARNVLSFHIIFQFKSLAHRHSRNWRLADLSWHLLSFAQCYKNDANKLACFNISEISFSVWSWHELAPWILLLIPSIQFSRLYL